MKPLVVIVAAVSASLLLGTCVYVAQSGLVDCLRQRPMPESCGDVPLARTLAEWNGEQPRFASDVAAIVEDEMSEFRKHPVLQQRVQELLDDPAFSHSSIQVRVEQLGTKIVSRGIGRLPADELAAWNRLRIQLADNSPEMCAAMWTGRAGTQDIANALSKLEEPDLREWLRISAHAGVLELESSEPTPSDLDPLRTALDEAAASLSESDQQRFTRATEEGTNAAPADACLATRTLLPYAAGLQAEPRDALLRSIAGASAL